MYVFSSLFLIPSVVTDYEQGQERAGTFKWVPFARAHSGGKGGAGTEREGTGTAEEDVV